MAFPVDRCSWCSRLVRYRAEGTTWPPQAVACPAHQEDANALAKAFYSVNWRKNSWLSDLEWARSKLYSALGVPPSYLGGNYPTGVTNPRFTELEVTRRYKGSAREQWAQQLKDGEAWVAPEDEWKEFT